MKQNILKSFVFFGLLVLLATACKDRDAEKKIAQLESRLAELEGKKSPDPAAATPRLLRLRQKQNLKAHFQPWSLLRSIMTLAP